MKAPYKFNRNILGFLPATIMWTISMVTFVGGLSFDATSSLAFWIGCALAVSNTIIQVLGNNKNFAEMDFILQFAWLASYALGITTSTFMMVQFLQIDNLYVEWIASGAIGILVEIFPEYAFVQAIKALPQLPQSQPYGTRQNRANEMQSQRRQQQPERPRHDEYRPAGSLSAAEGDKWKTL